MKEITTRLTQRGQVTVPVEVQRLLGIRPRDRVVFAIDNGDVRLVPARYQLEAASGSLLPPTSTDELLKLEDDVKLDRADRTAGELNDS